MKNNLLLLTLVIFIISLIITLNIFFQQSYQSEMAEQFNRQQLIIAKTTVKNIEDYIKHLEEKMIAFSKLLPHRGLDGRKLKDLAEDTFSEVREDINVNLKIIDSKGRVGYSSSLGSINKDDIQLFEGLKNIEADRVLSVDRLREERKILLITPIKGASGWSGAVILEILIDTINRRFLSPIRFGIRGYAWMMDSNGTLLYHPTQPKMIGMNLFRADSTCLKCHESFEVEKKILESGDVGFSSYIAPYGEDKLIAFSRAKFSNLSWIVCVSIPYSEVTFSTKRSMKLHSMLVIAIFVATVLGTASIIVINRKRAKAEERAREQMMHSEKLSALARISAGIAHEIGNPLTSISSYVQILREMEFDDFTKESLNTISRHINRISDIVRQMSSFSKTTAPDIKPHKINGLLNSTLELVRYDKRLKDININIEIPSDLPEVMVDGNQTIQIVMNIIFNAGDAMPSGGALSIKASVIDKDIEVSFRDTGPGIPEEHMSKIFDPFFSTKEKGTGLGLAVSYSMVKSFGGDITAQTAPEGGAIFKVRLPRAA
jgi:signal transduction histidine kinase